MFRWLKRLTFLFVVVTFVSNLPAAPKKRKQAPKSEQAISGRANVLLWSPPKDLRHRNLFFGPGGSQYQPQPPFTFIKVDHSGTSPKFYVRAQDGTKWKIKVGPEARPETVATRLVWAVGYRTDADYFLRLVHVKGLPAHLHRGEKWVGPGGAVHDARLERYWKGRKKVGDWDWRSNPFSGTRQLNGLRVMMGLINNWDLENDNNFIYDDSQRVSSKHGRYLIYLVSDLGASFGAGGRSWTLAKSKDDLKAYRRSKFIRKVSSEYVDFNDPAKPPLLFFFNLPEFILRLQVGWVCRHIPRTDVRWIGHILAELSPQQIRDAFRAGGYTPQEVEDYSQVVEGRIAELNDF